MIIIRVTIARKGLELLERKQANPPGSHSGIVLALM